MGSIRQHKKEQLIKTTCQEFKQNLYSQHVLVHSHFHNSV